MKTICGPSVYVVGVQEVATEELDRFLADHEVTWTTDSSEGSEVLCETAGRVCYMSFAKPRPGGNQAYLGHIKEVGHGSVLEHAVWNLIVTGVSRSLSHELVRHRAGMGYSQLSQRYVDESVAEYVVPPDLQEEVRAAKERRIFGSITEPAGRSPEELACLADAGDIWLKSVSDSHAAYVWLSGHLAHKVTRTQPDLDKTSARKYARQAARSVLPNATETKIFVTANARALRHLIEMRASRHADPEIRKLAVALWEAVAARAPALFGDYQRIPLSDGTCELTTQHRKV